MIHPDITKYPAEAVRIALSRGFDIDKHSRDIYSGDIDAMGSSHPILFLTEQEQIDIWEKHYENQAD